MTGVVGTSRGEDCVLTRGPLPRLLLAIEGRRRWDAVLGASSLVEAEGASGWKRGDQTPR